MRKVGVLAGVLIGAVLGGFVGAGLERHREATDQRLVAALRAVEVASLCADALRAGDEAKPEVERRVLEARMGAALAEADRDLTGIPEIPLAIPNLIEGVRRARQHAVANNLPRPRRYMRSCVGCARAWKARLL